MDKAPRSPYARLSADNRAELAAGKMDLDFCYSQTSPFFPPRGAAGALAFFFAAALHFDGLDGITGSIDGRAYAGDDYLWKAFWRESQKDPGFFLPAAQAGMTEARLTRALADDQGRCPLSDVAARAAVVQGYGRALGEKSLTPRKIVEAARAAPDAPRHLLDILATIPGYRAEDAGRRPAFFLAMILMARPEKFLP